MVIININESFAISNDIEKKHVVLVVMIKISNSNGRKEKINIPTLRRASGSFSKTPQPTSGHTSLILWGLGFRV